MLVTSGEMAPEASFAIPELMSSKGATLTVTPYFLPNSLSRFG